MYGFPKHSPINRAIPILNTVKKMMEIISNKKTVINVEIRDEILSTNFNLNSSNLTLMYSLTLSNSDSVKLEMNLPITRI